MKRGSGMRLRYGAYASVLAMVAVPLLAQQGPDRCCLPVLNVPPRARRVLRLLPRRVPRLRPIST
jgi:hypothetical protein